MGQDYGHGSFDGFLWVLQSSAANQNLDLRCRREAATATTESAATTADATSQTAAQDAAARAGTDTTGLSCGGLSFTAGTKVLLANGNKQPISTLKTGQKVLATNTSTGKNQAGAVAAVLVHHDTDLYDLRIKAGTKTAAPTCAPPAAAPPPSSAGTPPATRPAGCGTSPSPATTTSTSKPPPRPMR
ncbi:MAG TPA: hypothetical protein VIY52_15810 [Streptosporangiaceae bacterium]